MLDPQLWSLLLWIGNVLMPIRIRLLVGCRTASDSMGYMLISLHAKPDHPAYYHLKADPASDRGYAFTVEVLHFFFPFLHNFYHAKFYTF
jgi:hypothetical protein